MNPLSFMEIVREVSKSRSADEAENEDVGISGVIHHTSPNCYP